MAKYKTGDLFQFEAPGKGPITARILLDIKRQCIKRGSVAADSPLRMVAEALLVEVYRGSDAQPPQGVDPLIPGVLVDSGGFDTDEWRISGSGVVDPTKVEFPQALTAYGSDPYFIRGEVKLPLKLSYPDMTRIKVYVAVTPSSWLANIAAKYLGAESSHIGLARSDLRFSEHRAEVYRGLDDDPNQPYFEFSKKQGFDLSRFYEPQSRRAG